MALFITFPLGNDSFSLLYRTNYEALTVEYRHILLVKFLVTHHAVEAYSVEVACSRRSGCFTWYLKGTHARDFIVRFTQFFGIIQ